MEDITRLKCACGNCGETIEYPPQAAGQIVECPKCKEKSRLPVPCPTEPTENEATNITPLAPPRLCPVCGANMAPYGATCETCESRRRRNLKLFIGLLAAVAVLGIGWLFLMRFYSPRRQPVALPAHVVLQPPRVKAPKSTNDFKISGFYLESKRGSSFITAVGDISNTSLNTYAHLKATVDLLDARGAKIGSVTDMINGLPPDRTWRFIATVKDPRAKSVRFANVKEIP